MKTHKIKQAIFDRYQAGFITATQAQGFYRRLTRIETARLLKHSRKAQAIWAN